MFQETKKKPEQPDMVKRIQDMSARENERKRKEDAEKAKNKGKVDTAPSKGALSRLYDLFAGTPEEKKKK